MSRRTRDIQFALASQTIYIDCPDGRPTSVTDVQVWDYGSDDTSQEESATTGSATVETNPNTTTSSAAGSNQSDPRAVTLTSGTGVAIGRTFRIISADSHYEDVTVASGASTSWTLRHPLLNAYASGASFYSTRVSITLDTTWVSDQTNLSPTFNPNPRYRVKWTVVISGVTYAYETSFDLVRYTAQHHVTPLDVAQLQSNWLDWLGPDDRADQGRNLIDRAWQAVKFDLYGDNKADQAIRNPEALDQLVVQRAVQMSLLDRAQNLGDVSATQLDVADRNYRQRYDQLIRSPVVQVDTAGGGAAQPIKPTPLWSR